MLNKDQYNEDIYNDYYAKAAEGAEIKHTHKKGGKSKLLLIFLLLALISTLSYFVWTNLTSTKTDIPKSHLVKEETTPKVTEIKEKIVEVSTKSSNTAVDGTSNETSDKTEEESLETELEKTLQATSKIETTTESSDKKETSSSTAEIVANIASQTSDEKMSPKDIARIVQLVTQQMQAEKKTEEKRAANTKKEKDSLEASLENVETDTLSSDTPIIAPTDGSQKKEASNNDKTNTYNKIVLEKSNSNTNLTDELSRLSMEISNVIDSDNNELNTPKSTTYTSSLSKEVDTRTKEMRYYIVKKGDTLATIAYKIYGSHRDYKRLYNANPNILRRADRIYIGQRLRIPK